MEQGKRINTLFVLPVDRLNPLLESCFGEPLKESNRLELVICKLYSLYYQFVNSIGLGNVIIAKDMFPEENPPMLNSIVSLLPYKTILQNSPGETIKLDVSQDIYKKMVSASYGGYQIMEFEKRGVKDEEILKEITDNSVAYYYWCLECISEKRRIGIIGYKNGFPNIGGSFHEFDMQKFIPLYDQKKAFSISEDDFIYNSSKEEIENRLVDIISEFKDYLQKGAEKPILSKMAKQIQTYALRLNWNPKEFFEKTGWKNC